MTIKAHIFQTMISNGYAGGDFDLTNNSVFGGDTPKVILIFAAEHNTGSGSLDTNAIASFGFVDQVGGGWCASASSRDGQSSSSANAQNTFFAHYALLEQDASGNFFHTGTLEPIVDGVRVKPNITTGTTFTGACKLHIIALGGDGILGSAVYVEATTGKTSPQSINFSEANPVTPHLMFCAGAGTGGGGPETGASLSFGMATFDESDNLNDLRQASIGIHSGNNVGTTNVHTSHMDDYIMGAPNFNGNFRANARIESFDLNGFTYSWTRGNDSLRGFLAVEFANPYSTCLRISNVNTSSISDGATFINTGGPRNLGPGVLGLGLLAGAGGTSTSNTQSYTGAGIGGLNVCYFTQTDCGSLSYYDKTDVGTTETGVVMNKTEITLLHDDFGSVSEWDQPSWSYPAGNANIALLGGSNDELFRPFWLIITDIDEDEISIGKQPYAQMYHGDDRVKMRFLGDDRIG